VDQGIEHLRVVCAESPLIPRTSPSRPLVSAGGLGDGAPHRRPHRQHPQTEHCNDLIYRVCESFPKNFVGVCQLAACGTRRRSPTGTGPVLRGDGGAGRAGDSARERACNPNFNATGAHYLNADTTAFMQFLTADLFKDFPAMRMIIPHGGGEVPFH
jgi:hypothetical protein